MIQRKLTFYSFIGLLVSSVLIKNIAPLFIVALLVIWFSEKDFKSKFNTLRTHKIYLFLPLCFVFFALGLLHTDNLNYGLEKMETRLPLLILPLILPTLHALNFSYHKRVFTRVFVFAIILAAIVSLFRAGYLYSIEQLAISRGEQPEQVYRGRHFFGTMFTDFLMHPGYLAMYANVALIILLFGFDKIKAKKILILRVLYVVVLVLFIILLYAKAAIAIMILILVSFILRHAYLTRQPRLALMSMLSFIFLAALIYWMFPTIQSGIQNLKEIVLENKHDPNSGQTAQLRIHAWKASKEVVFEKPILGHGTGDVWDVLQEKYKEKSYEAALKNEINAHNEYYQTGLALGGVGMIFLVIMFTAWCWIAWKKRHFPLFLFSISTAFAFLFESFFNTQDGVIYASLFLFFVYSMNNINNIKEAR